MLIFNYFADIKKTLYDENYKHSLNLMKRAGVSVLWLEIYMSGRFLAAKDEIINAKAVLEDIGFEVNAITLPVGHPGNSLNPDEVLDLSICDKWRYRVNSVGENVYFCSCVNDTLIQDNKKVVELCRDIGIKKIFFDDDLRMANFGDEVCGCFCENCTKEFSEMIGKDYTREQIAAEYKKNDELFRKWTDYNCSKITRFMKETAVDGVQTGIMVMIEGGREQGIDIKAIKAAVPDCLFRVGEWHFDDACFESDIGHKRELGSIKKHLSLVGNPEFCYSETTVFPPRALSPENLIKKAELAIKSGIKNIFLMSGSWVMDDEYWQALENNLDSLKKLGESMR